MQQYCIAMILFAAPGLVLSEEGEEGVVSKNIASGVASTAMGEETTASGDYSTAMGWRSTASGKFATAMGYMTSASGNYSTAMGLGAGAPGKYSTATGLQTIASGKYSTVMGLGTVAASVGEVVIGLYNEVTAGGGENDRREEDAVFRVGVGSSPCPICDTDRKDAFRVMKNGDVFVAANDGTGAMLNVAEFIKDLTRTRRLSPVAEEELTQLKNENEALKARMAAIESAMAALK